jgi:hypothetical protein
MNEPNFRWETNNYFRRKPGSIGQSGRIQGYSLIGCDSAGVNAFFVRNDLVKNFFIKSVKEAYRPPAYGVKKGRIRRATSAGWIYLRPSRHRHRHGAGSGCVFLRSGGREAIVNHRRREQAGPKWRCSSGRNVPPLSVGRMTVSYFTETAGIFDNLSTLIVSVAFTETVPRFNSSACGARL